MNLKILFQARQKFWIFSKSKIQYKLAPHCDASVSFPLSSIEQLRIIHLTLADTFWEKRGKGNTNF